MNDKRFPPPEQTTLLELPPALPPPSRPAPADPKADARLRRANRSQITWGRIDLDAQLPEVHPARAIGAVIERLDLSALYTQIEARGEVAGAPAIDPKILLALWVYATSEGEGSAREIGRLVQMHAAYRWLCGGVEVGYHTLSDFRSQQGKILDAGGADAGGSGAPGGGDARSGGPVGDRAASGGAQARSGAAPRTS
jgi:transposase